MRLRTICKSKIHHAIVTQADLNYVGSTAMVLVDRDNRFSGWLIDNNRAIAVDMYGKLAST